MFFGFFSFLLITEIENWFFRVLVRYRFVGLIVGNCSFSKEVIFGKVGKRDLNILFVFLGEF